MSHASSPDRTVAACSIAHDFAIDGEFVELVPHERGHIHDTFVSTWRTGPTRRRYLHQRMNARVFPDVPGLMSNVERVTRHLRGKLDTQGDADGFTTLELVPTRAGEAFLDDARGSWRTYHYIEGTTDYDECQSEEQAYEAARAFGRFQAWLSDLDPAELHVTIPDFFDSEHRLRQFEAALARDPHGRAAQATPEIRFVKEHATMAAVVEDHLRAGRLPHRIVHGDTKLNNVLFDERTGKAVCIVDLDTCMQGYTLYDFGDLVRFTAATCAEDERDPDRAGVDLGLYRALVAGYLESAAPFLTGLELQLMPFAARLVTLTIGMRFLADHLLGDQYFKIARPGHNLDRARIQLRMVEAMERLETEMTAPVRAATAPPPASHRA